MCKKYLSVEFTIETCCWENCGVQWAMTDDFILFRGQDKELFYCPNGHSQLYGGETTEKKLRKQLKFIETEHEQCLTNLHETIENKDREIIDVKRSRAHYKGKVTKLNKDIENIKSYQEA